jgi:hypothetical protein
MATLEREPVFSVCHFRILWKVQGSQKMHWNQILPQTIESPEYSLNHQLIILKSSQRTLA